ncbi:hypothetical protein [Maricaulis sp.]|uniref:hypothetical protein n=1 Tax=Maricaulis sp. TaxID=1486257 RepID=UPI0025BDB85A|nr:hypothetical protein [Maricaulis sp.]
MMTPFLTSLLLATTAQDAAVADVQIAPQTEFQTPEVRLAERLDALAGAGPREAPPLIDEIHALWAHSGSATIALLMDRGRAAEQADNADIAARMYDHVTQLDPGFAEGWLAAGRMAAQAEDWAYALESLNTALTLEPRRYDAYLTIARLLERANEVEAALEAYNDALAIYPAHEAATEARDRLLALQAGRAL